MLLTLSARRPSEAVASPFNSVTTVDQSSGTGGGTESLNVSTVERRLPAQAQGVVSRCTDLFDVTSDLGQMATQELELPGIGLARQAGRISVETMHAFGIDSDVGLVAGRSPALAHEKRIVDQGVHGSDREQRRGHAVQTSVQRRDVGVAPLF